ncbi:hypothetical protein [Jiulongibacter sediminis]|uniref:hypothetical protein n=1 Tax=Jiulongibacter sediminis TaxID=1605367 RepID=UPI0026EDDDF6|nr:hypothetical protein [Jiulongibacter sediminis]
MKTKTLYLLLGLILTSISCNKLPEINIFGEETIEYYETEDEQFPLAAVDEDLVVYGFSQELDNVYVEFPNEDKWLFSFDDNHYPTNLLIESNDEKFLVLFSEFREDKCDFALVNQTTFETEYFYDAEFDGMKKAVSFFVPPAGGANLRPRAINVDIDEWWETYGDAVKQLGGDVVGGVFCGLSVYAAATTGGFASAVAVANCGAFASSFTAKRVGGGKAVVIKSGSLIGKYAEAILKCAFDNKLKCIIGIGGNLYSMVDFLNFAKNNADNQEVIEVMELTHKTAGLAGNWQLFTSVSGFDTKIIYYFGESVGRLSQRLESLTAQQYALSESTLVFEYEILSLSSFRFRFTTVTQNNLVRDLQENAESRLDIGPISYEEFINQYSGNGAQLGAISSNQEVVNFTFSENRKKMTLSTSLGSVELTRVD